MSNFACILARKYGVLPLRETAPDYDLRQEYHCWDDEQITHIRRVLHRLTSIRIQNPDDAEDLVQDTMLTMTLKFPPSELRKGLLVWSMGILRKKIGNYYRKAQRYASLNEQGVCTHPEVRRAMTSQPPDARVQYAELRTLVNRAVRELPPRERQVLDMLLAGMTASRIAQLLTTERYQNILNRLYRGRQKLQRELSKHGYGPGTNSGRHKA